jgi:type IV pilus assembly protein PilM
VKIAMPFLSHLTNLVKDPPPRDIFELSEAGIAFSRDGQMGFEPFAAGTLRVSPLDDNILRADAAASLVNRIVAPGNSRKRRPAALILPDFAARVSVLDFDSFPASPEEQTPLVRFRVKKSVPFDIDSASVGYFAQPAAGSKKIEVVAVTVSFEILARYEALFRGANLHPGEVTTATVAALHLYREPGTAVIAKLADKTLTVAVAAQGRLKLFRCLPLEDGSDEEILGVLNPTFAYVEDELGQKVPKLITCGFDRPIAGLRVPAEPLRSRLGTPGPHNAGLLGYLEGGKN